MAKMKFRIRFVENDESYGTYYDVQYKDLFLWHTYSWYTIVNNTVIKEFKCKTFAEAKNKLKEFKSKSRVTVVYEEDDEINKIRPFAN